MFDDEANFDLDFIFVSFFTMLILSSWFYLPSHVRAIVRHIQFYLSPEADDALLEVH